MSTRIYILNIFILIITLNFALSTTAAETTPKRELRSAWLATVYAIDWPQTTSVATYANGVATQKSELVELLDNLKNAGFNAVSFQVRSMCDAMYKSSYEPWCKYLTGTRGGTPYGNFDPLEYCIEQAHARGMECHAWVNPFRFDAGSGTSNTTSYDNYYRNNGMLMTHTTSSVTVTILNPALESVRTRVKDICHEIAENYDVDGIMFDDYFYNPEYIPEDNTASDYSLYENYLSSGGTMTMGDWRRDNINKTLKLVYDDLQTIKNGAIRFGISPAGIGGGNGGDGNEPHADIPSLDSYNITTDDTQYNKIYSDPIAWLKGGYIDYISPQIYWVTTQEGHPFGPLCNWWSDVAYLFGRHCYVSHTISAFGSSNSEDNWNERVKQVNLNREYSNNYAPGCIFYSASYISGHKANGFGNHLKSSSFQYQSLPPEITWKSLDNPGSITNINRNGTTLTWTDLSSDLKYTIYAIPREISPADAKSAIDDQNKGIRSEYLLGVSYNNSYTIPSSYTSEDQYYYAVVPFDRLCKEWEPSYYGAPLLELEGLDLISPNNEASIDLFTQQFSWNSPLEISEDTKYVIEISSNSNFSNIITSTTTTEKSITMDVCSLESDGTYYWRVKAYNDSYASTTSASRSFIVPTRHSINLNLVSPANEASIEDFTHEFTWNCEFSSDVNYLIEISDSESFENVLISKNSDETNITIDLSEFPELTSYFWRVTATKSGYITTTTDVWEFKTPSYPTLSHIRIILPVDKAQLSTDISFVAVDSEPTDNPGDFKMILEISTEPNFETIFYSGDSRWEIEYDNSGTPHKQYTLPISVFYDNTYYWRVRSTKTGTHDGYSTTREFTVSGQSTATNIYRDTDEYPSKSISGSSSEKIVINNLWINSQTIGSPTINTGYDAAGFCVRKDQNGDQGGRSIIYVSRHFSNDNSPANATWQERTDCHIDYYDAATGKYIATFDLNIGSEYYSNTPSHYFCNGLFCDEGNNLCFYGHSYAYTKDYNTYPSYMQISIIKPQVSASDARSGEFKLEIAEQKLSIKGIEISGEIEHFNVYGDITSGEAFIFAVSTNGNTVYRWHFIDGVEQSSESMTITSFYPSTATSFGSAPRIYPIDSEYFYIDSYGTDFTLYKWGQSTPFGSFAQASAVAPSSSYGSGGTFFTHNNKPYIAYASSDYASGGYKINIAKLSDNASDHKYSFTGASSLWSIPNASLGSVDTGDDRSMAVDYLQHTFGTTQNTILYLYSESNGMAAYSIANHIVTGEGPINFNNDNTAFKIIDKALIFETIIDHVMVYNSAGILISDICNTSSLSLPSEKGIYFIHVIHNNVSTTEKVILK
ncbi:MAG: family 10 glycosylhydrolase [Muribaculaceae bacterium]|nr:family 10 glycosylhydrolase [Muribaculaceae bacterium]